MYQLIRYTSNEKKQWNDFLDNSRFDTFLFYREFMDYHADRFVDCSFLFFRKHKLIALIPGNISDQIYYSHQGLTFGGLISSRELTMKDTLQFFEQLKNYLKEIGISEIIYKPVPLIYHIIPSQEDIYALFCLNATKIGCNISSTIFQKKKIKFNESRKSGCRKAKTNKITIKESNDFSLFWKIIEENLTQKYGLKPIHTLNEITHLKSKFTDKIKLYTAELNNEVIAGTVLFTTNNIIHVQYISANELGKKSGALDFLFDELINSTFINVPYFDFGHSNEEMGKYLNENLIFQKEGFGGRGVVYEIYKICI